MNTGFIFFICYALVKSLKSICIFIKKSSLLKKVKNGHQKMSILTKSKIESGKIVK